MKITDEMVERAARAMCERDGFRWDASNIMETANGDEPEQQREYWLDKADAALTAALAVQTQQGVEAGPEPYTNLMGDGETAVIECLAGGKPFVFDPATNFLHADDGTIEEGIRYVPSEIGGERSIREEILEYIQLAYDLSTWAACINWRGKENQKEWLDELREKIEAVQEASTILRAAVAVAPFAPPPQPREQPRSALVDVPAVEGEPVGTVEIHDLSGGGGTRGLGHIKPDNWWHNLPSGTYLVYAHPPRSLSNEGREIDADLLARCKEIVEWKKTGKLPGEHLRRFGQSIADRLGGSLFIDNGLNQAELQTIDEALNFIIALSTRKGSAGDGSATGTSGGQDNG